MTGKFKKKIDSSKIIEPVGLPHSFLLHITLCADEIY